jgi:hypothetical protein
MEINKITTKIEIKETQLATSDSNNDLHQYNPEMTNLRFKEHLELLKLKVKGINDQPSSMELLYGYFPINIKPLRFWWL